MRTFFGHLACECESVRLSCYAVTTADATMEITGHQIVCLDCIATFHDVVDEVRSPSASAIKGRQAPGFNQQQALSAGRTADRTLAGFRKRRQR